MNEIVLQQPDTEGLRKAHSPLIQDAQALEVIDKATHEQSLEMLAGISRMTKQVRELFKDPKADANKAHKSICAAERKLLGPLEEAKGIVSRKADSYEAEQERIAKEERERIEAAQRKEAEDRRLAEAEALEEAGHQEEAAALLDEPEEETVAFVPTETAKVEGVSTQKRWSAEVVDKMELIKFVAANPEWEALLDVNMPNANRLAVSMKGAMPIKGLKAVSKTIRAVRG